MANFRHKDEDTLRWNRIKRRIRAELDTRIRDWREEALNKLYANAFDKYQKELQNGGDKLELESEYENFARKALMDAIGVNLDEI